jgi:hypothetical protein
MQLFKTKLAPDSPLVSYLLLGVIITTLLLLAAFSINLYYGRFYSANNKLNLLVQGKTETSINRINYQLFKRIENRSARTEVIDINPSTPLIFK